MHRRSAFRLLVALAGLLLASAVVAAPRDNAANQKIEEAINKYYLATDFDKAEAQLKGIIEACEDRCSPGVKARAWMYIGIVRGSGRQDIAGAQESFQQALALDPKIKLDDALATPQVQQAFAQASGGGQAAPEKQEGGGQEAAGAKGPGAMECTPAVKEVEMQRPIPVACTTEEEGAAKVTLRYMVFGGTKWQELKMTKKGDYWQAQIPCSETGVTGALKYYVQAKDKDGEQVDSSGTKKEPNVINVVAHTEEEPPSFPGEAAPQKCMEAAACPPDMVGTPACPGTGKSGRGGKGWGTPCDTSQECDSGLLCMQGDSGRTCETAPSCTATSDCPSGSECMGGKCDIGEGGGGAEGPYKKNWIGLHFAGDIAFIGGNNICSATSDFYCYYGGGVPVPPGNLAAPYTGNVKTGASFGTARILASYERLLTSHIGVEGRLGFAFNGGPAAPNGTKFLPLHLEARGKYWFIKDGFEKKGLRPYVHLGGGIAQVDAKISVTVVDCTTRLTPSCLAGQDRSAPVATVDAYRKLGQTFVTLGGGAMYAIGVQHGLVLNVNFMYMLGSSGPVIEPSLGYAIGL